MHGQELYLYEQAGVIYYVGFEEPTSEDLEIMSQWLKVPVVQFFFEGPAQYKDLLEKKLNELGVLIGIGDPLRVAIRTSRELSHYEVVYKEYRKSGVINILQLTDHLTAIFSELFPVVEKPKMGFVVEIGERIDVKKTLTSKPVEFKYKERIYSVTMRGQRLLLTEGFYDFFGRTIYVDRDMNIDESAFFVEGAQMVYKYKDGFAIYKDGKLSFPNGPSFYVDEPFDVIGETVIQKLATVKIDGVQVTTPVLGRCDQYLLLANGVITPLDLSWAMKVCGPILDWSFNDGKLYVLDISFYVKAIDLKTRKIIWEKRFPRAWGVGSSKEQVYIGVDSKIITLDENGQFLSSQDCHDFGVWKEGIITLESPQQGYVLRSYIGSAVLRDSESILYVDEPRRFEHVLKVKFFDWGAVVVTQTGCWVVEK